MEHNYFIHVHSQGEDIPIRAQCLYILLREAISTISAAILEANSHYQENLKAGQRNLSVEEAAPITGNAYSLQLFKKQA